MTIAQTQLHSNALSVAVWCRRAVVVTALASNRLMAQQQTPAVVDATLDQPVLSASLRIDGNNSGSGTWMQLSPNVAFNVNRQWNVAVSLPLYYLNAASSIDGAAAATGVGDAMMTLSVDLSTDTNSVYASFAVGAPTGNSSRGFGAGKATWDLSGGLATLSGPVGPYVNAGVSNNINVASEALASGAGSGRLVPGQPSNSFVHAETGVEVDLGRSIYATGSVYGVFALSSPATTTANPGLPRRGPRGRLLPQGSGSTKQTVASDDVSDHGVGAVLWGQVTESLDVGVWVSRSLVYQDYTTVSISLNVNVANLGRRQRTHQ